MAGDTNTADDDDAAMGLNNGDTTDTDVPSPVSAGAAENVGTCTST